MDGVNQSDASQTILDTTTTGVDVSKDSFHVIGTSCAGKPRFRRKVKRQKRSEFFANYLPCLISMGACLASHHLVRKLAFRVQCLLAWSVFGPKTAMKSGSPRSDQ